MGFTGDPLWRAKSSPKSAKKCTTKPPPWAYTFPTLQCRVKNGSWDPPQGGSGPGGWFPAGCQKVTSGGPFGTSVGCALRALPINIFLLFCNFYALKHNFRAKVVFSHKSYRFLKKIKKVV